VRLLTLPGTERFDKVAGYGQAEGKPYLDFDTYLGLDGQPFNLQPLLQKSGSRKKVLQPEKR
jgi:hypothetical protein